MWGFFLLLFVTQAALYVPHNNNDDNINNNNIGIEGTNNNKENIYKREEETNQKRKKILAEKKFERRLVRSPTQSVAVAATCIHTIHSKQGMCRKFIICVYIASCFTLVKIIIGIEITNIM